MQERGQEVRREGVETLDDMARESLTENVTLKKNPKDVKEEYAIIQKKGNSRYREQTM